MSQRIQPVWTAAEAREADRQAMAEGVPYEGLLAVAGFQLARYVHGRVPRGSVAILAGPGSNGGDGWVAARHLARHHPVAVVPLAEPRFPGADGWVRAARASGVEVLEGDEAVRRIEQADVVVDAIFGTGFHGSVVESPAAVWLRRLGASGVPVIAADIVSGVNADTGAYDGPALNVMATVTMGAAKWGLVGYPGAEISGQLVVADIGLPQASYAPWPGRWIDDETAKTWWPRVRPLAHKYDRGHVIVVGGSRSMPGAPVLAGMAALRAGAGLVEVVVPESALGRVETSPALIVHGVPEATDGDLVWSDALKHLVARADAVVVGPGLGRRVGPRLLEGLALLEKPTVIDADALRLLPQWDHPVPSGWVLTPHAGELGALLGWSRGQVDADRRKAIISAVERYRAPTLLKGRFTLVASDAGIWVNPTGHPALATAGSGDVLSGMVARLLAAGLSGGEALALAAYWHGWAGELGAARLGYSLTAVDLLGWLHPAAEAVQRGDKPTAVEWWH
ncbi:MAG: NAD(P)H-hydrate dehydratase [Firmicutes bacterium]|nr:NAD(P)H-hydrate dehydratase [Bacillota bacterium]